MNKVLVSVKNFFGKVGKAFVTFFSMVKKAIVSFYRAIIKKFNNFRLTSFVTAGAAFVGAAYSLAAFFLYHFAGEKTEKHGRLVGFLSLEKDGRILGFIFFLAAVLSIILTIYAIYTLIPHMLNKEKVNVKKSSVIVAAVAALPTLLVTVLSIYLIAIEDPNTEIGIIVSIPFGALASIALGLLLVPALKCEFYMPAIKQKK